MEIVTPLSAQSLTGHVKSIAVSEKCRFSSVGRATDL